LRTLSAAAAVLLLPTLLRCCCPQLLPLALLRSLAAAAASKQPHVHAAASALQCRQLAAGARLLLWLPDPTACRVVATDSVSADSSDEEICIGWLRLLLLCFSRRCLQGDGFTLVALL
jgi:hypothetical protein